MHNRQIYIAKTLSKERPMYKVGISKNPGRRMKEHLIDYRLDCELLYSVDAPQDRAVELAIHQELKPHKSPLMKRCFEWYEADYFLIKECVERAVRDFHPIKVQKRKPKKKVVAISKLAPESPVSIDFFLGF